ncbi:MAG TPA: hypothetical protein VN436_03000 [Holophaga sp.]|nr:hypothetical protein [Holophaga sp.]
MFKISSQAQSSLAACAKAKAKAKAALARVQNAATKVADKAEAGGQDLLELSASAKKVAKKASAAATSTVIDKADVTSYCGKLLDLVWPF